MSLHLIYTPRFKEHRTSPEHPEGPWRAEAIVKYLKVGPLKDEICLLEPDLASFEILTLVHEPHYLLRFEEACLKGLSTFDGQDNEICFESYEISRLAAGAVIKAVDLALKGENLIFCPVRPPGHHAEKQHALGFCFLNNVAIGARYWQSQGADRLLILDWDAHHGNGIQNTFYEEASVFYLSLHEDPRFSFPGTGYPEETGKGAGKGYNLNVALPLGSDDKVYLQAFEEIVEPAVNSFKPQGILLAAGFDAHQDDDMSFMNLSTQGFEAMSQHIRQWSKTFDAPIISVLEGGYNPRSLLASVEAHLYTLFKTD